MYAVEPRAPPRPTGRKTFVRISLLLAGFRLFAVVAAFQLSGAAHLAGDLVEELTFGQHPDVQDDGEDDPNHECPPGCPTCHHVHMSGASLPLTTIAVPAWVPMTDGKVAVCLLADDAPSGPALPGVYRPPRA